MPVSSLSSKTARVARVLSDVARHGLPGHIIYFGGSLGDNLLCTAIFRELRKRGRRGLWMMTSQPALFAGNSDVDAVVPADTLYRQVAHVTRRKYTLAWRGGYDPETDTSPRPDRHLISVMCREAGLDGEVALRPYLWLSDAERAAGRCAERQIAIQSSGQGAAYHMANKEWYPERFQEVVTALGGRFQFVQVGSAGDPPLAGAIDKRGALSLRETAAVLSQSEVFVGQVGFLMHLARAVDCRSVIVYGGRELPWQSGYSANENLTTTLPCSDCWLWNRCDYDRECMKRIHADVVIEATLRQMERRGQPLPLDVDVLPGGKETTQ